MTDSRSAKSRLFIYLPLAVFLALAIVFALQLLSGRDNSTVPSALIGRDAPETSLPPLEGTGLAGIASSDFAGQVTVLNVWASWCGPCREEHPYLLELGSDERFVLAGMNYKDAADNARKFLEELGNPFDRIGVDRSGRAGIEWGVYGVPETFVIDRTGQIVFKHVGPLDANSLQNSLFPAIEKSLGQK